MNLNGVEYYYVRNGQNDIIGLIDGSGTQVVSYTYDSWGKPVVTDAEKNDANDTVKDGITGSLANTVGVKNPYRYRGYRYDTETGLYYLNSRYYNPEWGRFINADAIAGSTGELLSHNVFAYCKNNPVNMHDPNGTEAIALGIAGLLMTAAAVILGVSLMCITQPKPLEYPSFPGLSLPHLSSSKTKSKSKSKSKTEAITNTSNDTKKPSYWIADYNTITKNVDIGAPITRDQAKERVTDGKSIMCANYTKASQIALIFPGVHIPERHGDPGDPGYYWHFHINYLHGDPHIWFYSNIP